MAMSGAWSLTFVTVPAPATTLDRLADAQPLRPLRARLDQEHQLRALLQAVDHRRGELRRAGDEAHLGADIGLAAVAADGDGVAELELGQRRLVDEEAHLDVARRQQRDDRPAGRHQLAAAVIDLLDAAGDRAEHLAARQPGLRGVEPRLRGAQARPRHRRAPSAFRPALQQRCARSYACCAFVTAASCMATSARCSSASSVNSELRSVDLIALAHRRASRRGRPRRGRRKSARPRPSPGRTRPWHCRSRRGRQAPQAPQGRCGRRS